MKKFIVDRRKFGALLLATGSTILIPTGSGALAMGAGQVARRLNKSDRMSMLTERVAKAVALIHLGLNIEEDLAQLQSAHDEFDDILLGFNTGEGNSGLTKERIFGVRKKIQHVEELWTPLRTAIEEIVSAKAVDDEHFELVETHDVKLEHACHDVVKAFEAAYGGHDIEIGLAMAIDLAGRQRMLTQKMTKDLAFSAANYHVEESHIDFEKSCVTFGKIIDVLITGGGNIMSISMPPNEATADALERVKAHWTVMEPLAKELHSAEKPDIEKVGIFAKQSEILLEECDTVSHLYEQYVAGIS